MSRPILVCLAALACLGACGESPAPKPREWPSGLVVEFDGLRIWEHEIEPLLAYARTVNRRIGQKTAIAGALDNHLIPLKLAERAWPEQRARLRERAEALRRAVGDGGYPELVAKGSPVGGPPQVERWSRNELPPNVAAWVFDRDKIGLVSPVLATPQGFSLASAWDITAGTSRSEDVAEACQITFYTHGPQEFDAWLNEARSAVAGKVTYLDPDYRGCLPSWMESR